MPRKPEISSCYGVCLCSVNIQLDCTSVQKYKVTLTVRSRKHGVSLICKLYSIVYERSNTAMSEVNTYFIDGLLTQHVKVVQKPIPLRYADT